MSFSSSDSVRSPVKRTRSAYPSPIRTNLLSCSRSFLRSVPHVRRRKVGQLCSRPRRLRRADDAHADVSCRTFRKQLFAVVSRVQQSKASIDHVPSGACQLVPRIERNDAFVSHSSNIVPHPLSVRPSCTTAFLSTRRINDNNGSALTYASQRFAQYFNTTRNITVFVLR